MMSVLLTRRAASLLYNLKQFFMQWSDYTVHRSLLKFMLQCCGHEANFPLTHFRRQLKLQQTASLYSMCLYAGAMGTNTTPWLIINSQFTKAANITLPVAKTTVRTSEFLLECI